ncbi:MAG: DUF454 family protein [Pseudomonadaceae bacterium]|nr:DUF454 family protein [Pseudomonadaceae bacterium]
MRVLWLIVGILSLVSGVIGLAVPLWPSTPFLLLAAFAFSRGSERLHHWLHHHRYLGPPIHQWRAHKAISRSSKVTGVALMLVAFLSSIAMQVPWWALTAQVAVLIPVAVFLMTRPEPPIDLGRQLLNPDAFPHEVSALQLIETHLSWIVLTGDYAYKIKKAIKLNFVDFSTLDLRRDSCVEELRLNRQFTPQLYLDVVPILGSARTPRVGEPGDTEGAFEWAVKMLQFNPDDTLDRALSDSRLTPELFADFGTVLAGLHSQQQPLYEPDVTSLDALIKPMTDNFATLMSSPSGREHEAVISALRERLDSDVLALGGRLVQRADDGFIRECHGDLHLGNLLLTDDGIRTFDALEFNRLLRCIDPISDVAFLYMDCAEHDREDLAFAFADAYFDTSGDYNGMALLPLYARYRSVVRAKVAALQADQQLPGARRDLAHRLDWTLARSTRTPGCLIIMCGLSGSGKSYLSERLVHRSYALRIRSDVMRKQHAGLAPLDNSNSGVDAGIYSADHAQATYNSMAELAEILLREGENVIIDAACLLASQRQRLASAAGTGPCVVVYADAPGSVLRERIWQRQRNANDPSEATVDVLNKQLQRFEPPRGDHVIRVDAAGQVDLDELAQRIREDTERQRAQHET